jgi:ABC-type multidrug transport system fused ATPase/permease subunit
MTETSININEIMYNATTNNGAGIISILPLFIGYYLEDIIFTRSIAEVTADIPKFVENVTLYKVFLVLLPYILALILFYISSIILARTGPKIELDVLDTLIDKLIESIKTTKKSINVNELMIHIEKLNGTKNIYGIVISYIIPTIIIAIVLIYNFLILDGMTGIMIMLIIIILTIVTMGFEYNTIDHAHHAEESINDLYNEIHDIMINLDTVMTSDMETKELDKVEKITYDFRHKTDITNVTTTYGLRALSMLGMLGINYLAYNLYRQKKIDNPSLITVILLSLLFMEYYNHCVNAFMDLVANIGRLADASKYFSTFKILQDNNNPANNNDKTNHTIDPKLKSQDIRFKNITVRDRSTMIFNGFNLLVEQGTKLGLLGANGSGKTLLLKMLAGIINFDGDIFIGDQNLKQITHQSIAEHIVYISQHPKLFNKSIIYNLGYGSDFSHDEIKQKLKDFGLLDFFNTFPDKLNTVVGKEGSLLAGGHKQLILLIRAIIQNKSIFLLDDPSSGLDQKNKNIFMDLIKNIKNKTIIVATHDKQLFSLFDKTIDILDHKK